MMKSEDIRRWTLVFKALANPNRIKIIDILSRGEQMSVTEIADELDISIKATSKHLIILNNLDVLHSAGRSDHVFYSLNKNLPRDIKETIKLFL